MSKQIIVAVGLFDNIRNVIIDKNQLAGPDDITFVTLRRKQTNSLEEDMYDLWNEECISRFSGIWSSAAGDPHYKILYWL